MFNPRDKFGASSSLQSSEFNSRGFDNQDSSSDEDNEPFHGVRLSNDNDGFSQAYPQKDGDINNELLDDQNRGTLRVGEDIIIEDFRVQIERFLAEGGKAHVYTAIILSSPTNRSFKQPASSKCVLKRIASSDKNDLNIIEREVAFMKALQGKPNIVEFYASKSQPIPHNQGFETFILMEYCSEGTLVEFMQQREHTLLKEPEILYFFHEICMGVLSMHQVEPIIIHRDLKVENILISSAQGLKICDFGSSTTNYISAGTLINVSQAQAIEEELNSCTTLQYRAPEMIDLFQRRGLTEKMDIWALGVLLYKLCYFKTPFEDTGSLAILNCKFDFPLSPDFQPSIKNIISWLLQENPSNRPDIEQLIEEVCRLRGVPCSIVRKKLVTPIQQIVPEHKARKNNSLLAEPLLAPVVQPQIPLFDFDTESITPMRRGRPTKSKASATVSPFNSQTSAPEKPNQLFADTKTDPFEMLAKGFDLPSVPMAYIPRPPSREEEFLWAVSETSGPMDLNKNLSIPNKPQGTFFTDAFQEKIHESVKSNPKSFSNTDYQPFEPSNSSSKIEQGSNSSSSTSHSNTINISSHPYLSKPSSSSKANPPLPPPKPVGLVPRLPLASQAPVPIPPPRASPRIPISSKTVSLSNSTPPPKPARKPKNPTQSGES